MKNIQDGYTFLIDGSGSLSGDPMEESWLGLIDLNAAWRFSCGLLGFLLGVGLIAAFRLPARVLKALALAPAEESLVDTS
jgi:hypothetical protein